MDADQAARTRNNAVIGVVAAAGFVLSVTDGPVAHAAFGVGMVGIATIGLAVVLYLGECRRLAEHVDLLGPVVTLSGLAVAAFGFVLVTDETALKCVGAAMVVALAAHTAAAAFRRDRPDDWPHPDA